MKFIIDGVNDEGLKARLISDILERIETGASRHCLVHHYDRKHFTHDEQILSEVHHVRLGVRIIFLQGS